MSDWKESLSGLVGREQLLFEAPMSRYTTFRIGGPAEALVQPKTEEELISVVQFARERKIPWYVIGNGSNLLVADSGVRGIVILTTGLLQADPIQRDGNTLTATAGVLLSRLAKFACDHDLGGLAFAHGIPGTLGAAIGINAGAYGGEMKDVITSVTYLDTDGTRKTAPAGDLDFGYRSSRFCGTDAVILSATLTLTPHPGALIAAEMVELSKRRREKQPLDLPSAGSAFKRPVGGFAAKLIEDCGLKGFRVGDAQVSEKHAGFVVNLGNATAKDVRALLDEVCTRVEKETGITLEPEIRFIG